MTTPTRARLLRLFARPKRTYRACMASSFSAMRKRIKRWHTPVKSKTKKQLCTGLRHYMSVRKSGVIESIKARAKTLPIAELRALLARHHIAVKARSLSALRRRVARLL
jgi:hypothetical protein